MDDLTDNHPEYDRGLFSHAPGTHYLHLLREVLLTYRHLLKRQAMATGLTGAQLEVMRELALAQEGESTVSVLARELGSDLAAVSRLVTGLQRLGLVERRRDDRDARRRPLVLTEEGQRLMIAFHAKAHEMEAALRTALDPESLAVTMDVLHTLRNALDSAEWQRKLSDGSTGRTS